MTPRELSDFEGRWTLTRQVFHANAPDARFEGEAVWTPDAAGLAYEETGRLIVNGHAPMSTSRRYNWRAGLDVYYEDGRFFHSVPPLGGRAQHWCDPDDYVVEYDFADWPQFSADWRVKGPRKDYRMLSRYSRA